MNTHDFMVSIGTAVLAFSGALGGVLLGSRLDQSNWEHRFQIEQRRVLLEKRLATMEKVVVVLNKAPTVAMLQSLVAGEAALANLNVACVTQPPKGPKEVEVCRRMKDWNPERATANAREAHTLNAEFAVAITLAIAYFGPETKQAVDRLRGTEWWKAGPKLLQDPVNAMGKEISVVSE